MKRRAPTVGVYAAIAAFAMLSGSTLRAEVPASGVSHMTAAFAALDTLARQTRARGTLPRWSILSERPVLEAVWDAPATIGIPPYSAKDAPLLIDIGEKQSAIYKTYFLFSSDPKALPDTAKNSVLFQDEITRSSVMITKAFAAEAQAITDFIAHLPPEQLTDIRRQGLHGLRLGMLELVSGFALSIRSPSLQPDNCALLIDALADNGADLAKNDAARRSSRHGGGRANRHAIPRPRFADQTGTFRLGHVGQKLRRSVRHPVERVRLR